MSDVGHHAYRHGYCMGGKPTPTYTSWQNMKRRCGTVAGYENIHYDDAWEAFENFLRDMGPRPLGTSLDRIDGSKGYTKENCRWACRDQQNRNRAYCVLTEELALEIYRLAHMGVRHSEIASQCGCSVTLVSNIKNGHAWASVTEHKR